jgi:hypothetical protein
MRNQEANGNQEVIKTHGGRREGAGRKPLPRLVVNDTTSDPKLSDLLAKVRELFR